MAFIYNNSEVDRILFGGEIDTLESLTLIEDFIAKHAELKKKIDFLNDQKKSRIELLDGEVAKLKFVQDKIKTIISNTMKAHGETTLSFPSVGRVQNRKSSIKLNVLDEDVLIERILSNENLEKDMKEKGVIVTSVKLDKKEFTKILEEWDINGKYPDGIKELISKEVIPQTSTIVLAKDVKVEPEEEEEFDSVPPSATVIVNNNESFFGEIKAGDL